MIIVMMIKIIMIRIFRQRISTEVTKNNSTHRGAIEGIVNAREVAAHDTNNNAKEIPSQPPPVLVLRLAAHQMEQRRADHAKLR